MKIVVHKTSGKETTKKVDLNNNVFGFTPNDHAIYLDVKQYLAAQRTGTHKAKERSDVKGSRRKLRKQKEVVLLELVTLKTLYLEEEEEYLVLVQESMI